MSTSVTNIIPTLDTQSILKNPSDILAYVIRYYFTAPKSVSNSTFDFMVSFADSASKYQNVIANLVSQVQKDLMGVFNRFFSAQATTVNVTPQDNGDGSYNITVECSTVVNGKNYALGGDITVNNTGVLQIKWHPQFNVTL